MRIVHHTISLYIVATDATGNSVYSELISGIKVYGTPTITATDNYISEDTDLDFFYLAYDSFGEELATTVTIISGTQISGETLVVKVTATDSLGNVAEDEFVYIVSSYIIEIDSESNTATIVKYLGSDTSVIVPDSIYCYTITAIKESAFADCTSIISVVVPDSIVSIGEGAFSGCSSLVSITLPFVGGSASATSASSTTLFGYIFGNSSYTGGTATQQYYSSSSHRTYYIPTTLTTVTITGGNILYGAFYNCTSLISVIIGDSVTSIDNCAFEYCESLTSVTIGDGVTSIGDYAFEYCESLTSVTIGDGVTSISGYAFRGCTSLISVTIGSGVNSIGNCAFENCTSLTSVTIPDGVTSIGSSAFYNCTSLTSVIV